MNTTRKTKTLVRNTNDLFFEFSDLTLLKRNLPGEEIKMKKEDICEFEILMARAKIQPKA